MICNYNDFKNWLNHLDYRPKLLLHACCAPCSSHCILFLKKYMDVTIFFSNDNIYPKEEYFNRLNEMNRFVHEIGDDIKVISSEYNPDDYYNSVKGLEHMGEKSIRCYNCYRLRLEKTCKLAKKMNFDYFSTTLSISPYKLEKWINEIGFELEEKYGVSYLYSNFKKDNGYLHSIELSKEYGLYRQDYCGCIFSFEERKKLND